MQLLSTRGGKHRHRGTSTLLCTLLLKRTTAPAPPGARSIAFARSTAGPSNGSGTSSAATGFFHTQPIGCRFRGYRAGPASSATTTNGNRCAKSTHQGFGRLRTTRIGLASPSIESWPSARGPMPDSHTRPAQIQPWLQRPWIRTGTARSSFQKASGRCPPARSEAAEAQANAGSRL